MDKSLILIIILFVVLVVLLIIKTNSSKSGFSFNNDLQGNPVTNEQPKKFPPLTQPIGDNIPLEPPTVAEEIGFAMKYPQGSGVGMTSLDSNAFTPDKPGTLLTDLKIPEAYGESSLSDSYGAFGANQGSRILKIKNLGEQVNFKPLDEAVTMNFASAYSNENTETQVGLSTLGGTDYINYSDSYNPSQSFLIQSSPGQMSDLANCESTYPNTEKYEEYCITEGDIPYGKIVNGKVNPRLVSRWQSYTGDYDRQEALQNIDGLLYPTLNVL